MVPASPLV